MKTLARIRRLFYRDGLSLAERADLHSEGENLCKVVHAVGGTRGIGDKAFTNTELGTAIQAGAN